MNKRIKAEWLRALRSGRYKKAKGALRKSDGFCCLGVLCDLHRKELKSYTWKNGSYLAERRVLPKRVMQWAGLTDRNPQVSIYSGTTVILTLSVLNDRAGAIFSVNEGTTTFKQIAKAIESSL